MDTHTTPCPECDLIDCVCDIIGTMGIVGLTGKKRSGKDTVFQLMETPGTVRAAFADNLKREIAKITGLSVAEVEHNKESLRLLLQAWGADFRRQFYGEDYWVKAMEADLFKLEVAGNQWTIITDVRFPNEAQFLKDVGGTIVRVQRDTDTIDSHSSETAMDEYEVDYTINNNGTLDDLKNEVEKLRQWLNDL